MENQELIKRLKRWQMAKNPCVFSLHCRNKANPHPDIFSTLEPKEVGDKVVLFCPDCDYTQEEIPEFVFKALEAKVIPHPYDIEPSLEEVEGGCDIDVKAETKKMVEGMLEDGMPKILSKPVEIIFRPRMRKEREMYRKLRKVRSLGNAEKISRVNKWQQGSPDVPNSPFFQDYNMRCYSMACNNVSFFSKFKPEEVEGKVVLICPDCGFMQERIPDSVLFACED